MNIWSVGIVQRYCIGISPYSLASQKLCYFKIQFNHVEKKNKECS